MSTRIINVSEYTTTIIQPETKQVQKITVDPKRILYKLMVHPSLKLTGSEFLRNGNIAKKIRNCKEKGVEVSLVDYTTIKETLKRINGFTFIHIDMLRRIEDAIDPTLEQEDTK